MATAMQRDVLADLPALVRHAAEFVVGILAATPGSTAVALSGGSTPKPLYELLATPEFRDRVPWQRVHWFFGDERFVPPDHPDSNFRMAKMALFNAVPVPAANLHPVPTVGTTPEAAASAYDAGLRAVYGRSRLDPAKPLFAINLLGIGDDGHTASLFPGVAALDETDRWAAAVVGAKPEPRITLTLPALNSSAHAVFLAAGAGKAKILRRLAAGDDLPANRIEPVGQLHLMIDRAAAEDAA